MSTNMSCIDLDLDLPTCSLVVVHTLHDDAWVCAVLPPNSICQNPLACNLFTGEYHGYFTRMERRAFPRLEK